MLQFMLDTSLSDAEKFPLKISDLVVTSVNPESAPDAVVWCADPSNLIKDIAYVGLPGDYAYSPMQLQGEWGPYTETICSVDPSGRGTDETAAAFISQRNGFLYLHEMRAYKEGYSDSTLLDILRGCKKFGVTKLLLKLTLEMVLLVNYLKNIYNKLNKQLTLKKFELTSEKKIVLSMLSNLFLINTVGC